MRILYNLLAFVPLVCAAWANIPVYNAEDDGSYPYSPRNVNYPFRYDTAPIYVEPEDLSLPPLLSDIFARVNSKLIYNTTNISGEERVKFRETIYSALNTLPDAINEHHELLKDDPSRHNILTTNLAKSYFNQTQFFHASKCTSANFPRKIDFFLDGKDFYNLPPPAPPAPPEMNLLNDEITDDDQTIEDGFDESKWVNKNSAYSFEYKLGKPFPPRIEFSPEAVDHFFSGVNVALDERVSLYTLGFNMTLSSRAETDTTFNVVSSYIASMMYHVFADDSFTPVTTVDSPTATVLYTIPHVSYNFHNNHKTLYRRVCQRLPLSTLDNVLVGPPAALPRNATWLHSGCSVKTIEDDYTVCECNSFEPQLLRVFFHDRWIGHYIRIKLSFKEMFLVAAIFAVFWIVVFFILLFVSTPLNTRLDELGLRHLLEQWPLNSPFYFEKYSSPRDGSFLQLLTERVWIEWRNGVPLFSIFTRYSTHHYSSIDRTITLMMTILTAFAFTSVFLYDDFDINWTSKDPTIMAITGVICLACNFLFEHMYRFNSDRLRYFIFNYAEQLAKLHYTGKSAFFSEAEIETLLPKRSPTVSYLNIAKAARWPEPPAKVTKDEVQDVDAATMEEGKSESLQNTKDKNKNQSEKMYEEDDDDDDEEVNFTELDFKRRDANVLNEIMRIEMTLDADHITEMYRTRPLLTRLRYGKHNWTGYIFSFIWIFLAGFMIFVLKGARRGASYTTDISWIWTSIAASGLCIAFSIIILLLKSLITTFLLKRREDHKGPEHPYLPNTENHRRLEMTKFAVRRYINQEKNRLQRDANKASGENQDPDTTHDNRRGTTNKKKKKVPAGRRVTRVGKSTTDNPNTVTSGSARARSQRRRRRSTMNSERHSHADVDAEEDDDDAPETGIIALQVEEGDMSAESNPASPKPSVTGHHDIEMTSHS